MPSMWPLEITDEQGIFCLKNIEKQTKEYNVFHKTEYIFKQDDPTDALYFITKGRIKLARNLKTLER